MTQGLADSDFIVVDSEIKQYSDINKVFTPINEHRRFVFTLNALTGVFMRHYQELKEISDDICSFIITMPDLSIRVSHVPRNY